MNRFFQLLTAKGGFDVAKKAAIIVFALLLLPSLVSLLLSAADPESGLLAIALLSVIAYFAREHRLGRKEKPRRPGRAERRPILPRGRG